MTNPVGYDVGLQPSTLAKLKATYEWLERCIASDDSCTEQSGPLAGTTSVDEAADISANIKFTVGPKNPPCEDTENLEDNANQQINLPEPGCKRLLHSSCAKQEPKRARSGPQGWVPPDPPPPVLRPMPGKRIRTPHDPETALILDRCNINEHARVSLYLLKEHSTDGKEEVHRLVVAPSI